VRPRHTPLYKARTSCFGLARARSCTFLSIRIQLFVQEKAPRPCKCCSGERSVECEFCHGTGAMQLGDTLYCSDTGCSVCPVCRGVVRPHLMSLCSFAIKLWPGSVYSLQRLHPQHQRGARLRIVAGHVHVTYVSHIMYIMSDAMSCESHDVAHAGLPTLQSLSRQWVSSLVAGEWL
jgi:hypothetical protein